MLNGHSTMNLAKERVNRIGVSATRATHAVEDQTARIPPDTLLVAALGSVIAAVACELAGRKHAASFIASWAPTLLAFGLYNKISRAQRDMH